MSPPGAAITPDALNTGLRQCQSESTNPLTIGSTRCADTLRRGPLTDRHRTFPGGWGVNRDKPYRRGALGKLRNAVGVRMRRTVGVSAL